MGRLKALSICYSRCTCFLSYCLKSDLASSQLLPTPSPPQWAKEWTWMNVSHSSQGGLETASLTCLLTPSPTRLFSFGDLLVFKCLEEKCSHFDCMANCHHQIFLAPTRYSSCFAKMFSNLGSVYTEVLLFLVGLLFCKSSADHALCTWWFCCCAH